MAITTVLRTRILPILMSLAVTFFRRSSLTTAFIVRSPAQQILHHRSEIGYTDGSSSRRNSVLNNDNKSGDGSISAKDREDNVLLLPLLEAELTKLEGIVNDVPNDELKDIQRIQELKEAIDDAKTAAEFGVRRAQAEFYGAFSGANLEQMVNVWSRSEDVFCVHPGMESLQGFTAVIHSWEQIFAGYGDQDGDVFGIEPSRVKVDICGRTAICTCVEETNGGRLEALNIYRREGGSWKMVENSKL